MYSSEDFYTRLAESYENYASDKRTYLTAVDNFIKENADQAKTLADVGAGNGKRGKKIAELLNISDLTFIDNSEGMITLIKKIPDAKIERIDISSPEFKLKVKYDAVICLWNVLGHIPTSRRLNALKNIASIIKDSGVIFLDVNNRYNLVHYGLVAGLKNIMMDIFLPRESNGDFSLTLNAKNEPINTSVHIFSPSEIERLIKSAGLKIEKRVIINYLTGKKAKNIFSGQPVYRLSKT